MYQAKLQSCLFGNNLRISVITTTQMLKISRLASRMRLCHTSRASYSTSNVRLTREAFDVTFADVAIISVNNIRRNRWKFAIHVFLDVKDIFMRAQVCTDFSLDAQRLTVILRDN